AADWASGSAARNPAAANLSLSRRFDLRRRADLNVADRRDRALAAVLSHRRSGHCSAVRAETPPRIAPAPLRNSGDRAFLDPPREQTLARSHHLVNRRDRTSDDIDHTRRIGDRPEGRDRFPPPRLLL